MSTQFKIELKFQTYYDEHVALEVSADTEEEAIVAAKTHAKEHWNDGSLDKVMNPLTLKPRFNVVSCEECLNQTCDVVEEATEETVEAVDPFGSVDIPEEVEA